MQTKYSFVARGRRLKLLNPQRSRHHHPPGSCSRIHTGGYIIRVLTKKYKACCVVKFVSSPRAGVEDFKALSGWFFWQPGLCECWHCISLILSCCPSGIQRETRPCWLPWTEGELTTFYQHALSVSHCNYSLKDGIKNRVKKTANFEKKKKKKALVAMSLLSLILSYLQGEVGTSGPPGKQGRAGHDVSVGTISNPLGIILCMKSPKKQGQI